MAPPKSRKPQNHPDGEQCTVCGLVLARRGDMPRHMRTHLEDKSHMLHRCPWDGCTYSNLQRSNVDTHYRTHTGEQTQICPDCDFRSVDAGSLTRHRKRKHGYVPKPRKSRHTTAQPLASTSAAPEPSSSAATSRASRRHQPYSREPSTSSSSNRSSSTPEGEPPATTPTTTSAASASPTTTKAFPVIIPFEYPDMAVVLSETKAHAKEREMEPRSYFWRQQDRERIARSPSPKLMYPAVDAAYQMQNTSPLLGAKELTPFDSYLGWTFEQLIGCSNVPATQSWDFQAGTEVQDCQIAVAEMSLPPAIEELDVDVNAVSQPPVVEQQWNTGSLNVPQYVCDHMYDFNASFGNFEPVPAGPYNANWASPEYPPSSAASSPQSFEHGANFNLPPAASSPYSTAPSLDTFSSPPAGVPEDPLDAIFCPQPVSPSPIYPSTLDWQL
ncbi:hypothetical protein V5O48_004763 [Marasmius crinis-equi]|uniref:C2H2-type domain-containing protein n=1 Tax=Marasmius crinis-equi TaxID=585013 RepID=A0ABR3FP59_9AGAR